jgi:UDP-N-acetylmuramate dehydrogenase
VVIYNRARQVSFSEDSNPPTVRAESGANFGALARLAAGRGWAGLEWAAGIPGSVGGAVVGNAGAHGGDISGSLLVAEILHHGQIEGTTQEVSRHELVVHTEYWKAEDLGFRYRNIRLKRNLESRSEAPGSGKALLQPDLVVLAAVFRLERSTPEALQQKLDDYVAFRRRTQPPGASMGSMFKNPPGDYAGRLIESAGLKGERIGDAEISKLHGNFFINLGRASAIDVWRLIQRSRDTVLNRFGITLELEIELVGDWTGVGLE